MNLFRCELTLVLRKKAHHAQSLLILNWLLVIGGDVLRALRMGRAHNKILIRLVPLLNTPIVYAL